MLLIKSLLRFALCLIILFFVFRWTDFSIWQSFTLLVLVGIAYCAYQIATYKGPPLIPYRVVIVPKFERLLVDYKLLKNLREYDELSGLWHKKDQKLIAFTVLRYQANGDPLVYSDAYHSFLSEERFAEPIEALVFKSPGDKEHEDVHLMDPTLPDYDQFISPRIYLKYGKIGLDVREDWWKRVCAENPGTELVKTPVDYDYITGSAALVIATIPPVTFSIFRVGQGNVKKLWELIDKALAAHGWKRHEPDPDYEVRDPWIRIEHKYFHVQYREI